MIEVLHGDMFELPAEALVNTVNCVGTWGKGVAKQFKKRFPECFKHYREACEDGAVGIGKMHMCTHLFQPKYVINFPTKQHWKFPSRLDWIELGLYDLARVINEYEINSINIPALGCGNGGLNFEELILPVMLKHLTDRVFRECNIRIFYPNPVLFEYKVDLEAKCRD